MTTVYFATNRKKDGTGEFGYGAQIVGANAQEITYAVRQVTNVDLGKEDSGSIANPTDISFGTFSPESRNDIINAGKNLLVFIHGFDNTFEDAIRRAAFNREWFARGGAGGETTVVAFTWPSAGVLIDDPPHLLTDAYKADQAQAGRSDSTSSTFSAISTHCKGISARPIPKAACSFSRTAWENWALQAGVQDWFESRGSNDLMFDEVFLAAADEIDSTFEQPNGARLSDLPKIVGRISAYYSRSDIVMWVSATINLNQRLGFDGPRDKNDPNTYPIDKFRCIDCSEIYDYDHLNPFDASHQYYRRSKTVQTDIVSCMTTVEAQP